MPYLNTPVLLAKRETIPGTGVTLAGATDAFIISNLQATPLDNDVVRRAADRGFAGAVPGLPTNLRNKFDFDVELAGSGVAATPTKWGTTLLGACLFGAPVVATDVTYPLSNAGDGDTLTMYPFLDSAREWSRGVRGNLVLKYEVGKIPSLQFRDMTGLLFGTTVVDETAPGTLTLPPAPAGVEFNYLNSILQLDGYTVSAVSVEIDLGMKVTIYATTGGIAVVFDKSEDGDRRSIGFKAQFEMPPIGTKNYFTGLVAGTGIAMSLVHGTVAGNIVTASSPNLVLEKAPFAVQTNRLHLAVEGKLVPTAANNELVLKTS